MNTSNTNRMKSLFHTGKHRTLRKGQVIQSSDSNVALNYIASGYVKRYIINFEGEYKVQSIYAPGYVFPLTMVFRTLFDLDIYEGQETIYYNGLTDVELYSLDKAALLAAVAADPVLYRDLLYESGRRFHSNIQWLENASLKSSYARLVHILVYLGNTIGEEMPDGTVQIKIPLTHQDLSDILSIARETVSRHMAQLAEKKLVLPGRPLTISSIQSLANVLDA